MLEASSDSAEAIISGRRTVLVALLNLLLLTKTFSCYTQWWLSQHSEMLAGDESINKRFLFVCSLRIQHTSPIIAASVDVNTGEVCGVDHGCKAVLGQ